MFGRLPLLFVFGFGMVPLLGLVCLASVALVATWGRGFCGRSVSSGRAPCLRLPLAMDFHGNGACEHPVLEHNDLEDVFGVGVAMSATLLG